MTPFSASDAALEGFYLIRRRWRVVVGWAAFNLIALVMVVVLSAVLSVVASAIAGADAGAAAASATPAMALAGGFVLACLLFAQAMLAAGVFRLELRPDEPAFLHLRMGRDELRLALLWLIGVTAAWLVGWAGALVGHVSGLGDVVGAMLGLLATVYLGLRFSLVGPVSFAERRIDFPRSWALTRGRVLALLGMTALTLCLIGLLMIALLVARVLAAIAIGGFGGLAGVFGGADALKAHPVIFLLAFALQIALAPALWALATAPLAVAYREFAVGQPASSSQTGQANA
jgi:hypothetical protein